MEELVVWRRAIFLHLKRLGNATPLFFIEAQTDDAAEPVDFQPSHSTIQCEGPGSSRSFIILTKKKPFEGERL